MRFVEINESTDERKILAQKIIESFDCSIISISSGTNKVNSAQTIYECLNPYNGSFALDDSIRLALKPSFTEIPVKLSKTGYFSVNSSKISSLNNCPDECTHFSCAFTNIKNLIGGPRRVDYSYKCEGATLTSLEGLPASANVFEFTLNENLGILRVFGIKDLRTVLVGSRDNEIKNVINKILNDSTLNPQQKMLIAKKKLIEMGFEGNAKL